MVDCRAQTVQAYSAPPSHLKLRKHPSVDIGSLHNLGVNGGSSGSVSRFLPHSIPNKSAVVSFFDGLIGDVFLT